MMLLTFNYFLFLIITFFAYYVLDNKYKYLVLFFSSVYFIASISINTLLFSLLFSTLNYWGGLFLYRNKKNIVTSHILFWSLIVSDIGILIFYKYINFIFNNVNSFIEILHLSYKLDLINILLPIGISYYTFQTLGYLIRINRGLEVPEKNFIIFCNLLLFFPKFIAGPVERSNHFIPQIKNLKGFDQTTVSIGLRLITIGAFKKIVIADNIYAPISVIYSNIHDYTGLPLLSVIFLQLVYIYTDFSGYTDIALGSAKLFGINLIDNFNRPFLARSITEFWKRWHISLSSWCNEFIFLPFIFKYRKLGNSASVLGIFITFIIIGLWHGANWTFIILGLLQAIAIVYEFSTKKYRLKFASKLPVWLSNTISRIVVFIFMGFSLIFLFSNSVSDAWYFISHLTQKFELKFSGYDLLTNKNNFLFAIFCFLILLVIEIFNEKGKNVQIIFLKQPKSVRWAIYYILIIIIYFSNSDLSDFVYKNF